jgi:thymidylate synthase
MFAPDYGFKTIKEAQIELLHEILNNGDEVEDTIEIDNISVCIFHPLLNSEKLIEDITPIGKKHLSQMMLESNSNLEKTHYSRLHDWHQIKDADKYAEEITKFDQVEEVIKKLKENPFSKRCVITLWQPQDINDAYGFSYIFSQLFIRNNRLIMTNYFRSNDIYNAFPFNCFGVAKLQKEIADKLEVECGELIVHIGSAHIYKTNINKVKEYLTKN